VLSIENITWKCIEYRKYYMEVC